MKVRKRVTLTVVTVSVIFGVSYLTESSNYLMRNYDPLREFLSNATSSITILFNSAINPIVYALVNRSFREKFKRIISCTCRPSTNIVHPARELYDQRMDVVVVPTHPTQATDKSCRE